MGEASERPTGVWYSAVWDEPSRPGTLVIRVSMTSDVNAGVRVDTVCHDADEACALLRDWLAELVART